MAEASLSAARARLASLRAPRTQTPPDLLSRVLLRVGLADAWAETAGPIGPLYVAWRASGITSVKRAGDPAAFEAEYAARWGRTVTRVAQLPPDLAMRVHRRLRGERSSGPPIDLAGLTAFEQAVLRKTAEIPFGEVRPYAWVAREIGRPRAVRAVGSALAGNPVPFVIPCHRVVRSDGRIGQYGGGGPEAKRAVLRHEGVDPNALERLAVSGVRYVGSVTTGVFCFPSCRHARRIAAHRRVAFRSGEEASATGFRACRICRPLVEAVFAA